MRTARTIPRFGCDFCKKVATRPTIARHEPRCFKNPNRFCDKCENTGTYMETETYDYGEQAYPAKCPYCIKYQEYLDSVKLLT